MNILLKKKPHGLTGRAPWNKGLTKNDHPSLIKIAEKTSKIKKGVKLSYEHRKAISIAHKKITNWNYKGGVETLNKVIRSSAEYRIWREQVFVRDNFTCKKCNVRGKNLHPHHIENFSIREDLRFDVDNGITLCKTCHEIFHKLFGQNNNNKEQLNKYLYD